ncbi:hypothetical protein EC2731150_5255 [Escherichia coli 2731150]|nr:hypothetical protein EC2731150_5255 [Escherichia coli 2731150]
MFFSAMAAFFDITSKQFSLSISIKTPAMENQSINQSKAYTMKKKKKDKIIKKKNARASRKKYHFLAKS